MLVATSESFVAPVAARSDSDSGPGDDDDLHIAPPHHESIGCDDERRRSGSRGLISGSCRSSSKAVPFPRSRFPGFGACAGSEVKI